jgi:hypothetical protein
MQKWRVGYPAVKLHVKTAKIERVDKFIINFCYAVRDPRNPSPPVESVVPFIFQRL